MNVQPAPAVRRAQALLTAGQIPQAEACLRAHLDVSTEDVDALELLAQVAAILGRNSDAITLRARALRLQPDDPQACRRYAVALHRDGRTTDALSEVVKLVQGGARDPAHRELQAGMLIALGRHQDAADVLAAILDDHPERLRPRLAYGHARAALGHYPASVAAYLRSIELEPRCGEAWWSLANLKTFCFDTTQRRAMHDLLALSDLADEHRGYLEFALGKALEDAAEYQESFAHYERGNRLRRARSDYDAGAMSAFVAHSRQVLTAEFFDHRRRFGTEEPDPIFIIGLPRSGSTLVEQILASHSAVEGTMELPDLPAMAGSLAMRATPNGTPYPGILAHLSAAECAALGRRYLERTRARRHTGRPLFIDKAPLNFLHIGLIQLSLPNAKIIDVRRHPMACCLSAYTQHFADGYRFAFDLADLGHYYRDYVDWMQHIDTVLPGRVHRVRYETLLEDPDLEVRRLLTYCNLEFEPKCLRFYETVRTVATPSAFQVRQPLYRDGLDHWQHYAAWLRPLEAALGDALQVDS